MAVRRLNHAVLYVRDARRSIPFYREVLGLEPVQEAMGGAAVFLRARGSRNDHDLALFSVGDHAAGSEAGRGRVGLYHLAWEVPTLSELAAVRERLVAAGALVGESDHTVSKSVYGRDPDGLELEVMWAVPLEHLEGEPAADVRPLDLTAELARYGPATHGRIT